LWASVAEASKLAIDIRYRLLPYWETLFAKAHLMGRCVSEAPPRADTSRVPVAPLFFEFRDPVLYSVDLQYMIGPALLVSPCLYEGSTTVKGHFPTSGGTLWRDWYTHKPLLDIVDGQSEVPSPLGHIPLHTRGGSVILLHVRSQYTLSATRKEPYELLITLDASKSAKGDFGAKHVHRCRARSRDIYAGLHT
jgi:alpha-glucosidase